MVQRALSNSFRIHNNTNIDAFSYILTNLREQNISIYLLYAPENFILQDNRTSINTFDEKIIELCTGDCTYRNYRDIYENKSNDYFIDVVHLSSMGKEEFSVLLANDIAKTYSAQNTEKNEKK
jgi:hypothetical protein